jgi:hypothetical protein
MYFVQPFIVEEFKFVLFEVDSIHSSLFLLV